jgi:hypothetical protein
VYELEDEFDEPDRKLQESKLVISMMYKIYLPIFVFWRRGRILDGGNVHCDDERVEFKTYQVRFR